MICSRIGFVWFLVVGQGGRETQGVLIFCVLLKVVRCCRVVKMMFFGLNLGKNAFFGLN